MGDYPLTVALILPDRIVSDSKLSGDTDHTVGKIFRTPDGSLFVTAGDSRLTSLFEKEVKSGKQPDSIDPKENESFEAALLKNDGRIVLYDVNFAGFLIGETWAAIGSGSDVARSWYMNGASAEEAISKVFEVRTDCGPPVITVMLKENKRGGKTKVHGG